MLARMIRPNPTAGLVAGALAVVAAAGCGGDEQLSAEELVERGDQLCRQGQEQFADVQAKPPANAGAALEQTEELLGVAEEELAELQDLEPPDELRSAYENYLDSRARAIDFLEKGRAAAEDRDGDGYGAAQAGVAAEAEERERLARAVGFEACSRPPAGGAPTSPG
jgi:hypothetical protein